MVQITAIGAGIGIGQIGKGALESMAPSTGKRRRYPLEYDCCSSSDRRGSLLRNRCLLAYRIPCLKMFPVPASRRLAGIPG